MRGSGTEVKEGGPAPSIVNETKLAILAEMKKQDRPVTAEELHIACLEDVSQEAIDYHLCTLVKLGVVKVWVKGPAFCFCLTRCQESLEGAVPLAGVKAH